MTPERIYLIIGIIILGLIFIVSLVNLIKSSLNKGKECYLPVESIHTGIKYHASRYRFNRHRDMELYIYNHVSYNYEWYPIWHFKHSFIIAMQLDKDYALENMYKLMTMNNLDLTDGKK